jgi:hypothetical protein
MVSVAGEIHDGNRNETRRWVSGEALQYGRKLEKSRGHEEMGEIHCRSSDCRLEDAEKRRGLDIEHREMFEGMEFIAVVQLQRKHRFGVRSSHDAAQSVDAEDLLEEVPAHYDVSDVQNPQLAHVRQAESECKDHALHLGIRSRRNLI